MNSTPPPSKLEQQLRDMNEALLISSVKQRAGAVVVLARAAAVSVRFPRFWLDNRLAVATKDLEIGTVYNLFRRGKIKRFLAGHGWELM